MSSTRTSDRTRRDLLLALACAASISTLLPLGASWQASGRGITWLQSLRYLPFRARSARKLGELYRQRFPDDDLSRWPEDLMAASGMAAGIEFSSLTLGWLRDSLEARVRRDFAQGYVVKLEGWILSRTEARLCALYR